MSGTKPMYVLEHEIDELTKRVAVLEGGPAHLADKPQELDDEAPKKKGKKKSDEESTEQE